MFYKFKNEKKLQGFFNFEWIFGEEFWEVVFESKFKKSTRSKF
jgi:hypothetical protein